MSMKTNQNQEMYVTVNKNKEIKVVNKSDLRSSILDFCTEKAFMVVNNNLPDFGLEEGRKVYSFESNLFRSNGMFE